MEFNILTILIGSSGIFLYFPDGDDEWKRRTYYITSFFDRRNGIAAPLVRGALSRETTPAQLASPTFSLASRAHRPSPFGIH